MVEKTAPTKRLEKTTRRTKQHNTLTRTKQGKTFEDKTKEMRNEQEKTSTAPKGTYYTNKYIKRMNMNFIT